LFEFVFEFPVLFLSFLSPKQLVEFENIATKNDST